MIKELCERHGVSCVYTPKLFFERFVSSLTLNFPEEMLTEYNQVCAEIRSRHDACYMPYHMSDGPLLAELRAANIVAKTKRAAFVQQIFDSFPGALPDGTEFRMNKISVTFYFDGEVDFSELIVAQRDLISRVTIPRNDAEIEFLKRNTNKIFRDKLYFGQYKYCVGFKVATMGDYKHIREYVFANFSDDCVADDLDSERAKFSGVSVDSPRLYLSDPTDVMILQVGLKSNVKTIREIVLRDT